MTPESKKKKEKKRERSTNQGQLGGSKADISLMWVGWWGIRSDEFITTNDNGKENSESF